MKSFNLERQLKINYELHSIKSIVFQEKAKDIDFGNFNFDLMTEVGKDIFKRIKDLVGIKENFTNEIVQCIK